MHEHLEVEPVAKNLILIFMILKFNLKSASHLYQALNLWNVLLYGAVPQLTMRCLDYTISC